MMEHNNQQRHSLLLQEYDDCYNNNNNSIGCITDSSVSNTGMGNVNVPPTVAAMLHHNDQQEQQQYLDANYYYHQQQKVSTSSNNHHSGTFSNGTSTTSNTNLASTLSEFSAKYQEKEKQQEEQEQLLSRIIPFDHWNVYKLTVGLLLYRFPKYDFSSLLLNNNENDITESSNTKTAKQPQQQQQSNSIWYSDHHTLENDYSDPLLINSNDDTNDNDANNADNQTTTTTPTSSTTNNINDNFLLSTSFLRGFFYYMTIENMNTYGCCCCFKCFVCTAGYHNSISRLYCPLSLFIVCCLIPLSNIGLTSIEQFYMYITTTNATTTTGSASTTSTNDIDLSSLDTIQAILIALLSYIILFGIAALVQGTIEIYAHYYNDDDITTALPVPSTVLQGQQLHKQVQLQQQQNSTTYTVLGWWYDCIVTVCYEKFILLSGLYIIIVISLFVIGYIGEQIIYYCISHPKLLSLIDTTSWFQTIIDIPLVLLLVYISSITISIIIPCLLIECSSTSSSSSTPTNTGTGTTTSTTVLPTTTTTNTISLSTTSKKFQQNLQYYLLSIISCTIIRNIIYYPIWSIYRCYQLTKNYRTIMFLYCFILSIVWILSEYSIYLIRTYIVATLIELFSTSNESSIDLYDKYYDHITHPSGTTGSTYYSDILQVIDVVLFYLPSIIFIPLCAVVQTVVYIQLRSYSEYGYYTKQQIHIELNQHKVYLNSSNFISTITDENNNNNNNDNDNKSCDVSSKVLSPLLLVIPSSSASNSRQQQSSNNRIPFLQRQRQQQQQKYNYSHINVDDELDFEYDPPNVLFNNNKNVVEKFELGFGL